jgi:chromate reductase
MKILTFAASLRKDSFNKKLIKNVNSVLSKNAQIEIDTADFREFEMPMYDGDLEDKHGIPSGAMKLINKIQQAQAIIISTPEYNASIPGTLKNAIDWVSRAKPVPLKNKPLLLLATTQGTYAGIRGLWHCRQPFETLGTHVFSDMMGLPHAAQAFADDDMLKDPNTVERLNSIVAAFTKYAKALS